MVPNLSNLPAGSTIGVMSGVSGDLTLFMNDKKYPAGVRLPTDRPLYVIADLYDKAKQVTILESPEGK